GQSRRDGQPGGGPLPRARDHGPRRRLSRPGGPVGRGPGAPLGWPAMDRRLVLLRHGESTWNLENLFTGWYDSDLSPRGEEEARQGGRLMAEHGVLPDVVHTSVLTRAIRTAELALAEMGRSWIPVRRHWRLNERHYGDLQG